MRSTRAIAGFTLIELLLALTLLGLLTAMLFTSFYAVNRSWDAGRAAVDAQGHADYLMEQLSAALRSAYNPGAGEKHGLIFVDDGDDDHARDSIEWSKVGAALIGEDAEFAQVPHRVRVTVTDRESDLLPGGFTVRAWRQDLQLEEFNPEEDSAELCLSPKVVGFNCRMLDPSQEKNSDDTLNWIDEWTKTNTLPNVVELTLWLESADTAETPIEVKRIVELPMATLSQNPSLATSANQTARGGTSAQGRQGGNANGGLFVGGGGRQGGNRPGNQQNGQGQPGASQGNRPGGAQGGPTDGSMPPFPGGGGGGPPPGFPGGGGPPGEPPLFQ